MSENTEDITTPKVKLAFKVPVVREITYDRVANLLVSAFEGGSNYWIVDYRKIAAPKPFKFVFDATTFFPLYTYPLNEGGAIIIKAEDDETDYRLDLASIEKGLSLMAANEARHFNDFLEENDDAITADVFLQICLFGKVIFG